MKSRVRLNKSVAILFLWHTVIFSGAGSESDNQYFSLSDFNDFAGQQVEQTAQILYYDLSDFNTMQNASSVSGISSTVQPQSLIYTIADFEKNQPAKEISGRGQGGNTITPSFVYALADFNNVKDPSLAPASESSDSSTALYFSQSYTSGLHIFFDQGLLKQTAQLIRTLQDGSLSAEQAEPLITQIIAQYEQAVTYFVQGYKDAQVPLVASSSCYAYSAVKSVQALYETFFIAQSRQISQASISTQLQQCALLLATQKNSADLEMGKLAQLLGTSIESEIIKEWHLSIHKILLPLVYGVLERAVTAHNMVKIEEVQACVQAVLGQKNIDLKAYASYLLSVMQSAELLYQQHIVSILQGIHLTLSPLKDHASQYSSILNAYKQLAGWYEEVMQTVGTVLISSDSKKVQEKMMLYQHKVNDQQMFIQAIQTTGSIVLQANTILLDVIEKNESSGTVTSLDAALAELISAHTLYLQAENFYKSSVGAVVDQQLVRDKISELLYMKNLLSLKYIWQVFSTDGQKGSGVLGYCASDYMQYTDLQYAGNLDKIQKVLVYFYTLYTKPISDQAIVVSSIEEYIDQLIKSSALAHQDAQAANIKNLLGIYISWVTAFYDSLQAIEKCTAQDVYTVYSTIQSVCTYASKIDQIYLQNPSLASMFPLWITDGKNYQTCVSYTQASIVYFLMNAAVEKRGFDAVSLYLLSVVFSSEAGRLQIDPIVEKIISNLDFSSYAQTYSKLSVGKKYWVEYPDSGTLNVQWQQTLLWYQVGLVFTLRYQGLAKAQVLAQEYIQSLQGYIATYKQMVALSKQSNDDLLFIYYQWYLALLIIQDSKNIQPPLTWLSSYVSNLQKTGIFDVFSQDIQAYQNQSNSPDQFLHANKKMAADIQLFDTLCTAQEWYVQLAKCAISSNTKVQISSIFSHYSAPAKSADQSLYDIYQFFLMGVQNGKLVPQVQHLLFPNLSVGLVNYFAKQANVLIDNALAYEQKENFLEAHNLYQQALQYYSAALQEHVQDATLYVPIKKSVSETQTRAQASYFASLVHREEFRKVGGIDKVGLNYVLQSYTFTAPAEFVDAMQAGLPGTLDFVTVLQDKKTVLIGYIKAIVLYDFVTAAGYTYDQCFSDMQGTIQNGLTPDVIDIAQKALAAFETMVWQFGSSYLSVSYQNNQYLISMSPLQIPPLTALYPSAPYANYYYAAAQMLYAPADKNLVVGTSSLAPGNDSVAQGVMQEYMVGCLLATAFESATQAQQSVKVLKKQIASTKQVQDCAQFVSLYMQIKNSYQNAFAALIDSVSGAAKWYIEHNMPIKAQAVQAYALQLYAEYVACIEMMLIGNPTTTSYMTLLLDLHVAYSAQSLIDPSLKAQMDKNIAALFKQAGDACMNYQSGIIPAVLTQGSGFVSYEYAAAAPNYIAAIEQYTKINDSANVQACTQAKLKSYIYGVAQNFAQYMFIRVNGLSYQDAVSGQTRSVSFAQLQQDYMSFEEQDSLSTSSAMDPNELAAYNQMKGLLLDGLTMSSMISSEYKATSGSAPSKKLLSYLSKTVKAKMVQQSPDLTDKKTVERILAHAVAGLAVCKQDIEMMVSWVGYVSECARQMYCYDYLGMTQSTVDQAGKDMILLNQALQAEGTQLQNPSSAYIG